MSSPMPRAAVAKVEDQPVPKPRGSAVKPKEKVLPKSLGACADLFDELRKRKAEAKKVFDAIEAEQKRVQEHIIQNLPKGDGGAFGKVMKAKVYTEDVPRVVDWDSFYGYIAKKKRWDLLQRRVGEKAVSDMWEAGVEVPGVERFTVVKLSVTKV